MISVTPYSYQDEFLKNYTPYPKERMPNFPGKPVMNRIDVALPFLVTELSSTKPRQMRKVVLDLDCFGHNSVGKYLRHVTLICTCRSYSIEKKIAKRYVYNKLGIMWMVAYKLGLTILDYDTWVEEGHHLTVDQQVIESYINQIRQDKLDESYGDQMETGDIIYVEKSDRAWSPIQNIKSEVRDEFCARHEYTHNYDIENCAPTLIYQHAQELGMDEYLPALHEYVNNRQQFREQIAEQTGLTIEQIKKILTAMVCGAPLGCSRYFKTFSYAGHSYVAMNKLKNCPLLQQFKKEIKYIWDFIRKVRPDYQIDQVTKTGKVLHDRLPSKAKWAIYFRLENKVVQQTVKPYLQHIKETTGARYFIIHDGWTCEQELDVDFICNLIYEETGYRVKLSYEILESN